MPICLYAQNRLNPPLIPLRHTIHMDLCQMPVWAGPYAICHMPICPFANFHLNPRLMPRCHTIHMGRCHMPTWAGPYTIFPYGHMPTYVPIYMPIWSRSYNRARSYHTYDAKKYQGRYLKLRDRMIVKLFEGNY